jgi:probable rRNA maturation factor
MITIDLAPRSTSRSLSISALTRFLNRARLAVGLRGAVDVILTTDPTLRQLNKTFRGKNKPTDVLSFPAPYEFAKKHAGDLAISLDTAARQAIAYGHTLADEVKVLLLHGLLHLSGQDHETDNGEMATQEAALRRDLRLPTTLIERTTRTTTKTHISTKKHHKSTTKKTPLPAQKSSRRPTKKLSSQPKAALFAAPVEMPPHSPRTGAISRKNTSIKRGGQ